VLNITKKGHILILKKLSKQEQNTPCISIAFFSIYFEIIRQMCPHPPCGDSDSLTLPNKNRKRMERATKAFRKYGMRVRTAAGRCERNQGKENSRKKGQVRKHQLNVTLLLQLLSQFS
jgi:hypothetical protein